MLHVLTNSIQQNTVPALFSQSELPVELQLNSVISPHLMRKEKNDHNCLLSPVIFKPLRS